MSATFWQHIHGGSTHFPIVLLLASVVFDFAAWRARDESMRRGLHAAGFGSAVVGMLGGLGAVVAGLIMTRGRVLGAGAERLHHQFVWPAVVACAVFVGWRLFRSGRIPQGRIGLYLAGMGVASLLMVGAGYSGGEMLLAAENENIPTTVALYAPISNSDQMAGLAAGKQLYLKDCARCHGADAQGDDGPDLHGLDLTDEQIAARIRNGKKGQMTAFAGKLTSEEIRYVIDYLRMLK
ncbi:MAG TPA: c-type cytochrome [Verrucomicrobiae bacterium]|nr:c-type cytochrome [Verrucomicrobiae bacterium]